VFRTDAPATPPADAGFWRLVSLGIGVGTGCVVELVALPFVVVFVAFFSLPLYWMADLWRPGLLFGGSVADTRSMLVAADVLVVGLIGSGVAALVAQDMVGDEGFAARLTPYCVAAAQTLAVLAFVLPARASFEPAVIGTLILFLALGARIGARASRRWTGPSLQ
jgi:hypothetical protein